MSDVVERAKAALDGVTEGPWVSWKARRDNGQRYYTGNVTSDATKQIVFTQAGNTANTDFIAAARTLVPELLAEVERLRGQYDQAAEDWGSNDEQMLAENHRLAAEVERLRSIEFIHNGCRMLREKGNAHLLAEVKRLRAELDENVGVMNALRRHRDTAEAALEKLRMVVKYDSIEVELGAEVIPTGAVLAVLDGEQ